MFFAALDSKICIKGSIKLFKMKSVVTTIKPLPFHLLSPEEFERMTLWLITKRGYLRPQHLGEGGNEQGRDIVAYKTTEFGEELWYFQCKRYQKIGASTIMVPKNWTGF